MKKIIIFIVIFSLIITPIYANPVPATNQSRPNTAMRIVFVVTLGIGYLLFKAFSNDDVVEFKDEKIDIAIDKDNSVNVTGIYNFRRTGKSIKTFQILYPFPNQKKYGEIEIKSVTINGKKAKFHNFELKRYNRISLDLTFDDSDECKLLICFKQKPQESSYKYILRSTRNWKKELEESQINISLPVSNELKCNYSDFVLSKNSNKVLSEYSMQKKQFYPNEDLLITWSKR